MGKHNKTFLKIEHEASASENAEKQRLEIMSKFSGPVLYNLLRIKDQTTINAAQNLNKSLSSYADIYSKVQELAYVAGSVMDYKIALNYIREELGLKAKNDQYSVDIDENGLFKSVKDAFGEHSWYLIKVLFDVSRKAYGRMEEREAIIAAKKIMAAAEGQSDVLYFSQEVENALSAIKALERNLANFVESYAYLKQGVDKVSIRSIMQKSIGKEHEAILRTVSSIMSDHIANESAPSMPKITIERSVSGKDIGMAMRFKENSSYFAIVYLKPKDYNLISSFVIQVKEAIKELESTANPKGREPKLLVKTYSDIGICMVGSENFSTKYEAYIKDCLKRLFGWQ